MVASTTKLSYGHVLVVLEDGESFADVCRHGDIAVKKDPSGNGWIAIKHLGSNSRVVTEAYEGDDGDMWVRDRVWANLDDAIKDLS